MSVNPLIPALQQALTFDPNNGPLWSHLGELCIEAQDDAQAIVAFRKALELGEDAARLLPQLAAALRRQGQLSEALIRVEEALSRRHQPALRVELARILLAREDRDSARQHYLQAIADQPQLADSVLSRQLDIEPTTTSPASKDQPAPAPPADAFDVERHANEAIADDDDDDDDAYTESWKLIGEGDHTEPSLDDFDWQRDPVTFADVVGLDAVKKQIHLRIVAPFKQQAIFQAFSRKAGGGILLYGPPGCGKTYIARATAGEVGAQFIAVGIHEIVDKYFGESEKMVHELFEQARRRAPAVLFFDEFDALGGNRRGGESQFWKTLVDQLLQEMDGVGRRNENVLIFAATNAPWNIDSAFRRPGRFDRQLFVPPPDLAARQEMLRRLILQLPGGDTIAAATLAAATELFTGADLRSLCERASENALSRSLESGEVHPVTLDDFRAELRSIRSTAEEWLASARNYARYQNDGGVYDELTAFLKQAKRW